MVSDAFNEAPPIILAVEDDVMIRELIRSALEEQGFQVETAITGDDAIAKLERNDPAFRALITDIDLGGKNSGWDVAHRARELHPEIPVIYVTGGGVNEWSAHGVPNSLLVAKPFVPAQIVVAVSQLLNSAAPPLPSA